MRVSGRALPPTSALFWTPTRLYAHATRSAHQPVATLRFVTPVPPANAHLQRRLREELSGGEEEEEAGGA